MLGVVHDALRAQRLPVLPAIVFDLLLRMYLAPHVLLQHQGNLLLRVSNDSPIEDHWLCLYNLRVIVVFVQYQGDLILDGLSRDTLGYGLLLLADDRNRRLARVGLWQRLVQIFFRGELRLILRHGHPELRPACCITSFWLFEGGRRRRCLIDRSITCFRRFLQDNRGLLVKGVVIIVDF